VPLGPDPEPYVREVKRCVEAGFDHIAFHQVGPDQDGFLAFWHKELRPALERDGSAITPPRASPFTPAELS
jgi:hypothetical protein